MFMGLQNITTDRGLRINIVGADASAGILQHPG